MNSRVVIHPDLTALCRKLRAKDPARYEQLKKKIRLIVENPEMGKPLHPPLKGQRRVHIGHFVLMYEVDTKENVIILLRFAHHDDVYSK
jgi:addiction module RelE/StbE family toxin